MPSGVRQTSTRHGGSARTWAPRLRHGASAGGRSAPRSSTRPRAAGRGPDRGRLAPRWRRQSRFFSPTVDYVLKRAPCEVLVVAYPQGVIEPRDADRPVARRRGATLTRMKAIVIGCGRGLRVRRCVMASPLELPADGGLARCRGGREGGGARRLGEDWSGRLRRRARDGHGRALAPGSRTPTPSSSPRTATTRTSSSPRWRRSACGAARVVVRILDPARAGVLRELGLRTICPTQTAIECSPTAVHDAGADAEARRA